MRAYHDQALIDEFQRRGIDVSAIYDLLVWHPVVAESFACSMTILYLCRQNENRSK